MLSLYLPTPPSESEKYGYARPNGWLYAIAGLICLSIFSYTSLHFLSKHWALWFYSVFCAMYCANLAFCSIGSFFATDFDIEAHDQARDQNATYPSVDIYLPNCGEDLEILGNQFKAVKSIDYPNYQVWVLDDANRDQVRILAELHGFNYFARPTHELKKAGNLRYAFARTTGELILVLDADFAPCADILRESVHYFNDEKLAILQTPQFFEVAENQSAVQKGATFLQEVFYRLIQNFRDRWGASVCCGSNAIYRREALKPYGGAAAVERSEDVNTGLSVLRAGWTVKYLPLNLAKGLSPDTIKAFFNQQYRWCCGSMHLITSNLFWTQPIGIWGKFSYFLSILYYTTSGFGTFLFSLPSIVNVWLMPGDLSIANYSLVLPATMSLVLLRGFWARNTWGVEVLIASMAAGYTHLTGLIDVAVGDVAPWIPTGASNQKLNKFDRFKFLLAWVPVVQFAVFVTGAIVHRVSFQHGLTPVVWIGFQCAVSGLVLGEIARESQTIERG